MNEIASRYGLALYSLAFDEKKIESMQEEVKSLISVFTENSDFIVVLGSSFISFKERCEILEKTLIGVDKDIISLIEIVMENDRSNQLIDILYSFNSYCNEYRGVDEGYIYSTLHLDQSTINKIETKITEIEHKKVELKNIIDPTLIGGIKIVVHDRVYDGSIKNTIESMKNDLLKQKEDK